jgi:hypothetical protein
MEDEFALPNYLNSSAHLSVGMTAPLLRNDNTFVRLVTKQEIARFQITDGRTDHVVKWVALQ